MNRNIAVILTANASGFRAQMLQAAGSVKVFEDRIEGTGSRASRIGAGLKAAFAGMAVAAVMFFGNAVNQAVKFEAAMRNVNSISNLSEQALSSLSNQVLELSTQLPQSAQNLAEGLYEIASSGFQGAAGLKVLESSAMAASAGLTETDIASKAIVASLNAYGLTAADAADVSDILFQTVNLGVVSFEELATQLGDVVGGAAAAGVALDEVGAAVAAMTLSGLSAAEATTSLNRLITSLIDPSDELAGLFEELGYESGKAALDSLGLHGTMELLRESTGGNIETLLKLFPEIRSARGAFALMAADGKNYARTFAGITDEQARAGATTRAFNEQMKGLGLQWKLFMNNVSAVSIRVGTALIPALRSGLEAVQQFGSTLSKWFQSAATTAAPTVEKLGDAFQSLGKLLGVIAEEAAPLARALALAFGGAVLGAVHGLAVAVEQVAGFLAEHPGLVRAVAIAYGGYLVGQVASAAAAFVALKAQAAATGASMLAWNIAGIFDNLTMRVAAFGKAMYGLTSIGNMTGTIGSLKTAFSGLGGVLTSPAFAGTVLVGGLYAIQTALSNAKKHAEEWRQSVEEDIDFKSSESIVAGMHKASEAFREAKSAADEYKGVIGFLKSSAEVVNPFDPNTFYDSAAAAREASDAYNDWLDANSSLATAQMLLQDHLGVTKTQANELLDALEFDPANNDGNMVKLIEDARALGAEAGAATPAVEGVSDAMDVMGDASGSASDRVDALNDAIEGLFETMLGASNAGIAYQQAIDDLSASFAENGTTLDTNTEAGRANASAINEAADAAVKHAQATAESTGSVSEGVDMLTVYRQGLKDQLTALGLSDQAAEDYLATLGLAPEDIETLIELKGADEATGALQQVFDFVTGLDLKTAHPVVELDDAEFLDDSVAVGEALVQIGLTNSEATVTLDDSQFVPTAEQVTAWSAEYDDASLEAQALLNIIDPTNKFTTLSAAAKGWDEVISEATATADAQPAHLAIQGVKDRLHNWDSSSGTGDVLASDQASAKITAAKERLGGWDSSAGSADVNAKDNASGTINFIQRQLNSLTDKTVTITTRSVNMVQNVPAGQVPQRMPQRWGGITNEDMTHAASGLLANIYQNTGAVYFAEPETGGEAFIPRHGNRARGLAIAAEAASWYGADVVPKGERAPGGGGTVVTYQFQPNINVDVRPTVGVDGVALAAAISGAVGNQVNAAFEELRQEVRAR